MIFYFKPIKLVSISTNEGNLESLTVFSKIYIESFGICKTTTCSKARLCRRVIQNCPNFMSISQLNVLVTNQMLYLVYPLVHLFLILIYKLCRFACHIDTLICLILYVVFCIIKYELTIYYQPLRFGNCLHEKCGTNKTMMSFGKNNVDEWLFAEGKIQALSRVLTRF